MLLPALEDIRCEGGTLRIELDGIRLSIILFF